MRNWSRAVALLSMLASVAAPTRVLDKSAVAQPLKGGPINPALPGATAPPLGSPQVYVKAKAWILMDAATGRVLASHNDRQRMFPASTTKTLTALVAINSKKIDNTVRIGPNPPKVGESSVYLLQGETLSMRDLVRAAMIKSANDSCVAIAEGVAGSVPAFAEMMNKKAQQVGATDSHFVNPHGLHDPNHYTTARDLALIARAALEVPFFNQIIKERETSIHGNWKVGERRVLINRNRLLFRWPEADGVKTGYTRQAGRCLVASATRMKRGSSGKMEPFRLISVVLNSQDTWSDSRLLLERFGFDRYSPQDLAAAGESFGDTSVPGGAHNVQAVAARSIALPLRRDEKLNIEKKVHFLPLQAPLKRGQNIGTVQFVANNQVLAKVPLMAREAVPVSMTARVAGPLGHYVPSSPPQRWLIWGALAAVLALLLTILKLRRNQASTRKNEAPDATPRQIVRR